VVCGGCSGRARHLVPPQGGSPAFVRRSSSRVIGLEAAAWTDPVVDLNMGQTAEILAPRVPCVAGATADEYAVESQQRLALAQKEGLVSRGELEPMFARDGKVYDHDDGVRPGTATVEKLSELKPAFERAVGARSPPATARRSPTARPGSSWRRRRPVKQARPSRRARSSWTASGRHSIRPSWTGGRCCARPPSCAGTGSRSATSGCGELNEAFAAQVAGLFSPPGQDDTFLPRGAPPRRRGRQHPARQSSMSTAGAIGLGHPVGRERQPHRAASGERDIENG